MFQNRLKTTQNRSEPLRVAYGGAARQQPVGVEAAAGAPCRVLHDIASVRIVLSMAAHREGTGMQTVR